MIAAAVLLVAAGGVYFGARHDNNSSANPADSNSVSGPSGGSASTPSTFPAQAPGYLANESNFVDFIQWSDQGGVLSGSAQEVFTQGATPDMKTLTDTFVVSGSLVGSVLSLSFDHGPQVFGSIVSSSFTINFPQPGATMALVTFEPATSSQYDSAVAGLNQRVTQEDQGTSNAQALQQAETTIDSQVSKVQGDISVLAQDESATNAALGVIPASLQSQSGEVTKTQQAEEQLVADSGSVNQTKTCNDAGTVAKDASVVSGDATEVGGQAATVETSLSAAAGLRAAVSQLGSDYSQLQQDEAALPDYSPPNAPGQSEVSSDLSEANTVVQYAVSETNGYVDQSNSSVSTAYQYVAEAYKDARTCGTAPSAPTPLQPIS